MPLGKTLRLRKYDWLPIFSYLLFFITLYYALTKNYESALNSGFAVTLVCLTVAYICKTIENKKHSRNIRKKEESSESNRVIKMDDQNEVTEHQSNKSTNTSNMHAPFVIFSAVFAIIAALSITDILQDAMTSTTMTQTFGNTHSLDGLLKFLWDKQIILIISFFPIGILFYHCGIVFLSTEAAELIAKHKKKVIVFFSSLILFLEGIVLLLVSHSSSSISQFSLWIFILMALDISWVLLNLFARFAPSFQWLHFDSAMLLFTLTIILLPEEYKIDIAGSQIANVYWYILIVFTVRTFYDYHSGWKFWTKFMTPTTG